MEAINFTQAHDDGAATRDLAKAQVILVGVSRCGKTPTSLYLALQFGIRAANFPLTPDDFADRKLPASLLPLSRPAVRPHDQSRAAAARSARSAGPAASTRRSTTAATKCASASTCCEREGIPMLDTTAKSIEEIATTILHRAKLQRHAY